MADDTPTAEEFTTWLRPRASADLVSKAINRDATPSIIGRLRGAAVRAAAQRGSGETDDKVSPVNAIILIPTEHWVRWSDDQSSDLWGAGDVRIWLPADPPKRRSSRIVRYYGIRFEPSDIYAMVPDGVPVNPSPRAPAHDQHTVVAPLTPAAPAPSVSKGGRPPKGWWDDLWVEMFRRIHFGELRPAKLADLEEAMHQWLDDQGHSGSEKLVRDAARKLFRALMSE